MNNDDEKYNVPIRMSYITVSLESKTAAKEFIISHTLDVINRSSEHKVIQIILFFNRKLKLRINNSDLFFRKVLQKIPDERVTYFIEELPLGCEDGLPLDYTQEIIKKYQDYNNKIFNKNNNK